MASLTLCIGVAAAVGAWYFFSNYQENRRIAQRDAILSKIRMIDMYSSRELKHLRDTISNFNDPTLAIHILRIEKRLKKRYKQISDSYLGSPRLITKNGKQQYCHPFQITYNDLSKRIIEEITIFLQQLVKIVNIRDHSSWIESSKGYYEKFIRPDSEFDLSVMIKYFESADFQMKEYHIHRKFNDKLMKKH